MIARREVTSREVVEAHLARIDEVNPRLNAVVRRLDDDARRAADAADARTASGGPLGALHGVPFTVKENIDLAGTPTTHAMVALAEAVADVDAPVVERLRAAGGIPIGRTNLPDLGLRVFTESSLHGVTDNPWRSGHTCGGSSGGEAAAIASGMSPLGLGNDIGGSLRNPAHCCGIASIKPSTGVVPSATVIPPEDASIVSQLMSVEGVMARSVADVRAGFGIVAGPHVRDPLALPVTLTGLPSGRPLRVAVQPAPPGGATDPGVVDLIRRAADALADAGAEVVEAVPASYDEAIDLWARLLMEELRVQLPLLELVMGPDGLRFLGYAAEMYPSLDRAGLAGSFMARHRVERDWHRFLSEHDVLLTPVWVQPAPGHGVDIGSFESARTVFEMMRPVLPANLLGLPAAVAPAGLVGGLPVGAQFIARRFSDLVALGAAELLEAAVGSFTPIDPRS